MTKAVILWFRKGLRLHDNLALLRAFELAQKEDLVLFPLFCMDPYFVKEGKVGVRRWQFLLDTLNDLDKNLKKNYESRLYVIRANPLDAFEKLFQLQMISHVVFEKDTEPYALKRDSDVEKLCKKHKVNCESFAGHLLYWPEDVISANGGLVPLRYQSFLNAAGKLGKVGKPVDAPSLGSGTVTTLDVKEVAEAFGNLNVPDEQELGLTEKLTSYRSKENVHRGGETEALRRMEEYLKDKKKVLTFEKPKTSPAAFKPADTTVLSPYLKFGALSCRLFYHKLREVIDKSKGKATEPPVSLLGQLLWREFYYTAAYGTPSYGKMEGNKICLQVQWRYQNPSGKLSLEDSVGKKLFEAWRDAKTGYPWIDAIMTQLREEGWIHHLARHSVACFLTRGDLYVSWERGVEVFDELLLDADYSLNVGNWMWLSASAFFHQYFRIYSPATFGQKYDKKGTYVRKYLPVLKNMPDKFVYEPWKAPLSVQKQANCIIGKDYPAPIVDHDEARKFCMEKMKLAYDEKKYGNSNKRTREEE
jgi:cryptochrome